MASYTLLFQGDRLPTVGLLQSLLNRTGSTLNVDGVFGPRTNAALIAFQRARHMPPDGIADKDTWRRLFFHDELPLVDLIDVFDAGIYNKQAAYIEQTGGKPVYIGGMSNGLAQMGQALSSAREIFLLRIVGHGCPGVQAISMGKGGWIETRGKREIRHLFPHHTTSINPTNLTVLPTATLRAIFSRYGSLEMHGCHTAQGAMGHRFVRDLANVLGVPVTAGIKSQRSAIRFDGPTFTAIPGGASLAHWCANLPEFPLMTVP